MEKDTETSSGLALVAQAVRCPTPGEKVPAPGVPSAPPSCGSHQGQYQGLRVPTSEREPGTFPLVLRSSL